MPAVRECSHCSLSPPFHHTTACPTNTECMQWSARRSNDRKRAPTALRVEERLDFRDLTQSGLGVLHWREPPENWAVGCETSRGRRTHDIGFQSSTIDTNTLQDFLHFYDETLGKESEVNSVRLCADHTRLLTRMKHRPSQLNMTKMSRTL